jgi:hypothetical protein
MYEPFSYKMHGNVNEHGLSEIVQSSLKIGSELSHFEILVLGTVIDSEGDNGLNRPNRRNTTQKHATKLHQDRLAQLA